jgi:hypothetical protein
VSSYHEHKEPGLSRLTDSEWLEQHLDGAKEVPWLAPVIAGAGSGQPRYPQYPSGL